MIARVVKGYWNFVFVVVSSQAASCWHRQIHALVPLIMRDLNRRTPT